jgi:hypothetical protein
MSGELVLVTGGSEFVGSDRILQLLTRVIGCGPPCVRSSVKPACARSSVKRVVLTSSFAAIGYGAYVKSKILAERAAWDLVAREGNALELSVVNPAGVLGPCSARIMESPSNWFSR